MDSLYIIKKQLEECKEKLADYETRTCVNCEYLGKDNNLFDDMIYLGYCKMTINSDLVPNGSVEKGFGCSNFKRKTDV